ncbi:MAG: glycogen/starch synthase, partial [Clostridia bacterium]|nr:glycogen/starch synthase [Clostridia bacterium]
MTVVTKKTKKLPTITVKEKKKIIYIGSECAPFIATGGLADVMGSLPKAIAKKRNYDISVILPMYSNINPEFKSKIKFVTNFNVWVGWRSQYCGVFTYKYQGVTFYFLDNEYYFKR